MVAVIKGGFILMKFQNSTQIVIPAKAGIQRVAGQRWIPAQKIAGMTRYKDLVVGWA